MSNSPSLLGITEIWLDDSWPNESVINNSSYSFIRNDRNRHGGGSAIVFNNSQLKLKSTSSAINQSFNIVCGLFHAVTSDLNIICCYLPPKSANQSNDIVRINDLICCLSSLIVESATHIIIGDFNFKEINWACIDVSGYSPHRFFSKFLLDHGFSQFVLKLTREASILDLVLCDNLYTIDHVYCTENFSTSDHNSVSFCINTFARSARNITSFIPDFAKADLDNMGLMLSLINWRDVVSYNSDIDHCWANFYDIFSQAIRIFVPVRRVSTNSVSRKLVLPNYIRKLKLIKLKIWRALRKLSFDPILKKPV